MWKKINDKQPAFFGPGRWRSEPFKQNLGFPQKFTMKFYQWHNIFRKKRQTYKQ